MKLQFENPRSASISAVYGRVKARAHNPFFHWFRRISGVCPRVLQNRGLSFIEAIFTLFILAFCVPPLLTAFAEVQERNVQLVPLTTASHLARNQLEEALYNTHFAAIDDVASQSFAEPFTNYAYAINVDYVEAENLDTAVEGPTLYKRVQVVVTHNELSHVYVQLTGLAIN